MEIPFAFEESQQDQLVCDELESSAASREVEMEAIKMKLALINRPVQFSRHYFILPKLLLPKLSGRTKGFINSNLIFLTTTKLGKVCRRLKVLCQFSWMTRKLKVRGGKFASRKVCRESLLLTSEKS